MQMQYAVSLSPKCSRPLIFQSPLTTQRNGAVVNGKRSTTIPGAAGSSCYITKNGAVKHSRRRVRCDSNHNNNSEEPSPSFPEAVRKKLNGIAHLARPYAQINAIVAIGSVSFLPVQRLSDVTPTFLVGIVKAMVPLILMNISLCSLNQICDVEIDKINKPYLPLASGDLSMATAIAICGGCALASLVLGAMSGSPALLWAQILWCLTGIAYSVPLPYLRWKSHTFMAPFTLVLLMGLLFQIPFFIHSQRHLLGKPFVVTRPFIFATVIMSVYAFVNGILKDLPDVDGDKAFGMQTLCVLIGKEKVLPLCVNLMLLGFGGAMVAGAYASSLLCKLVTIIGHGTLAFLIWFRSRKVDLDSFESQFGFYMYLWKLNYVEYMLIHFIR